MDVQGWSLVAAIHPIRDKCRNGEKRRYREMKEGRGFGSTWAGMASGAVDQSTARYYFYRSQGFSMSKVSEGGQSQKEERKWYR